MSQQMTPIEVEISGLPAGQTVKGYAVLKNGVLWAHAGGETWTTDVGGQRRGTKKGGTSAGNPNEITAPMPGKIIKISAAAGSQVQVGDVVIVMEAMKMEYTLKAQAAGRVSEVRCAAGEQVPLGQVLAVLQLESTEKK